MCCNMSAIPSRTRNQSTVANKSQGTHTGTRVLYNSCHSTAKSEDRCLASNTIVFSHIAVHTLRVPAQIAMQTS